MGVWPNAGCGLFVGSVSCLHFIWTPDISGRALLILLWFTLALAGAGLGDGSLQVFWRIEGDTVPEAFI